MGCRYVWAVFDSLVGKLWDRIESEIVDLKERPIQTTILGKDPKNKGQPY